MALSLRRYVQAPERRHSAVHQWQGGGQRQTTKLGICTTVFSSLSVILFIYSNGPHKMD